MTKSDTEAVKRPSWFGAVIAGILVGTLAALTALFGATLPTRSSSSDLPLEVTSTRLSPSTIELTLANMTDSVVRIAQVAVNDQVTNFDLSGTGDVAAGASTTVDIDYDWLDGSTYTIDFFLGDGTVFTDVVTANAHGSDTVDLSIKAPTPRSVWGLFAIAAVAFVSVVVLAISALRKSGTQATRSVLGVAVGLIIAVGISALYLATTRV
ncbi:MAG: hypothetical protein LLG14_17515 [Nocardiaceae bacterium]|nr:hypothetical protein [Nocardiaceae bacterium]